MSKIKEHYQDELYEDSFVDDSDSPDFWVDNSKRASEIAACCKAINQDVDALDIEAKNKGGTSRKNAKIKEIVHKYCAIWNCKPQAIKDMLFTSVGRYVDLEV